MGLIPWVYIREKFGGDILFHFNEVSPSEIGGNASGSFFLTLSKEVFLAGAFPMVRLFNIHKVGVFLNSV